MATFDVTGVPMHDDLLQEGLLKRDKKAASFVAIGEPDIRLHRGIDGTAHVEIAGLYIYDPIKDVVKSRDVHDITYWMLDDDYDGSHFVVKQLFFCGGDKDEFDAWRKGSESLAAQSPVAAPSKPSSSSSTPKPSPASTATKATPSKRNPAKRSPSA
jgi:adenine-specific DNA-methyltransferase